MTPWIVHELRNFGFEVRCLDARHARAALKMQISKDNDQQDADRLAQIVRTGCYRSIHVKSFDSTARRNSRREGATRGHDDLIVQPYPRGAQDFRPAG